MCARVVNADSMKKMMEGFRKTVKPGKKVLLASNGADTGSTCSLLHHYVTVYLLFACFLLVSSHQHFGSPIHCFMTTNNNEALIPLINNYCFMSTTYTVMKPITKPGNVTTLPRSSVPVPGPGVRAKTEDDILVRHAYYQWVPLVLLLQAIIFMLPHWLWKNCEGGLVGKLLNHLDDDLERKMTDPNLPNAARVKQVADYFYRRLGVHNRFLGFMWIFCDFLALLNAILNFMFTDVLLGGKFATYGFDAFYLMTEEESVGRTISPESVSPLFPILTKCSIHSFGASGSLQVLDNLCLMTLNIVNEKIFFILWIWFPILAFMTILTILTKLARMAVLRLGSKRYWQSTIGIPTKIRGDELVICTRAMTFGDCVLFNLISKNMRPLTYRVFVRLLAGNIIMEERKMEKYQ